VGAVVRTSLQNLQLLAQRKTITLELTADPVPVVLGDAEKLDEVFSNLISNAVKYTEPGGRIDVRILRTSSGVRVSVHDTGIGIHPEDLPHVFTKFYRARNVSRADGKGSGVGLALVKAIVEGHNGRVFAVSKPNEGSTFNVELPAAATLEIAVTLDLKPEHG
jgi:signal transduction histidine kinase